METKNRRKSAWPPSVLSPFLTSIKKPAISQHGSWPPRRYPKSSRRTAAKNTETNTHSWTAEGTRTDEGTVSTIERSGSTAGDKSWKAETKRTGSKTADGTKWEANTTGSTEDGKTWQGSSSGERNRTSDDTVTRKRASSKEAGGSNLTARTRKKTAKTSSSSAKKKAEKAEFGD